MINDLSSKRFQYIKGTFLSKRAQKWFSVSFWRIYSICTYMPDGSVECLQAAPFSRSIKYIMWCNEKLRLSGVCISVKDLLCNLLMSRGESFSYVWTQFCQKRIYRFCHLDLKRLVCARSCRRTKTSREASLSAAATAPSGTRWEE